MKKGYYVSVWRPLPEAEHGEFYEVQVHCYDYEDGQWEPLMESPDVGPARPVRGTQEWCEGFVAGIRAVHDGHGFSPDEDGIRIMLVATTGA